MNNACNFPIDVCNFTKVFITSQCYNTQNNVCNFSMSMHSKCNLKRYNTKLPKIRQQEHRCIARQASCVTAMPTLARLSGSDCQAALGWYQEAHITSRLQQATILRLLSSCGGSLWNTAVLPLMSRPAFQSGAHSSHASIVYCRCLPDGKKSLLAGRFHVSNLI